MSQNTYCSIVWLKFVRHCDVVFYCNEMNFFLQTHLDTISLYTKICWAWMSTSLLEKWVNFSSMRGGCHPQAANAQARWKSFRNGILFHSLRANQKLRWVLFGSRDKGHCRFPFKVKKEGEKLRCSCNFALNFMVMHQEESTKDRRWLQVGTKWFKLSFCTKDFGGLILSGMLCGLNFMVYVCIDKTELNQPLFWGSFVLRSTVLKSFAQIRLHMWNFFS